MERLWRRWSVAAVFMVAMATMASAQDGGDEGFKPLFNGKDLTGWTGDVRLWSVKDGEIVGSTHGTKIKHNTFLRTDKEYGDFELRLKVLLENGNSGIQFRSEVHDDFVIKGYQADVAEKTYSGMLYEEGKRGIMEYWKALSPEEQAKIHGSAKQGEWNEYVITCIGDHLTFTLNGYKTLDLKDPEGAKSGVFALQLHTGPDMRVRFKDIEIREIPSKHGGKLLMPDVDRVRRERLEVAGPSIRVPDGFVVEQVATNDLIGSSVNLTFDHKGRPVIAREGAGVRILLDTDNDGKFDTEHSFSEEVNTAHGMHFIGPGDLLVHSRGPAETCLYRLRDLDGDDVADEVSVINQSNGGIGEHGPHTILTGADGDLYVLFGNHAHPSGASDPNSALRVLEEDHLLPRYVDPRGHANSIRAPGGTIHRLDPETGVWNEIAGGFRNPFDMAADAYGEIFAFDSDMEWDLGLPWFRPIRPIHVTPGGDYGWRTGSSKMPFHYIDTLPGVDHTVGRGSPVGTAFYYHNAYPARYHGAYLMGDWSRGRIRIMFPERSGATFAAETMDFVLGEPLSVTDLDVGPDGNVYFLVGGRGTYGGMYRVRYEGDDVSAPEYSGVEAVLNQPMPRSAWGREALRTAKKNMGDAWAKNLTSAVANSNLGAEQRVRALEALFVHGPSPSVRDLATIATSSDEPMVRAAAVLYLGTHPITRVDGILAKCLNDGDPFVQRRAAEALIRAGLSASSVRLPAKGVSEGLVKWIGTDDRHVRYAMREALTRVPRPMWEQAVLEADIVEHPRRALEGLLALIHVQNHERDSNVIFDRLTEMSAHIETMNRETLLSFLRVASLAFIRDKAKEPDRSAFIAAAGPKLLARFPDGDVIVNRELQVMLAHMQVVEAIGPILTYLTPDKTQQEQIHTVFCLRTIREGWTKEQRDALVAWFDYGREIGGAASMAGYINNLWDATLEILPDDERQLAEARKAEAMQKRAEEAVALMAQLDGQAPGGPSELAQMSFAELSDYLEYDPMTYREPNLKAGENVFIRSRCVNCHVFGSTGKGGGPDLSTVASRFRRKDLLEAIMYPSKVVSDQYQTVELVLDDFSDVTGMVAGENDDTLTVITINGERIEIAKSSIEERKVSDKSGMPEGLINTMSLGELVALIQYLEHGAN